jgi:hypothetical protein
MNHFVHELGEVGTKRRVRVSPVARHTLTRRAERGDLSHELGEV